MLVLALLVAVALAQTNPNPCTLNYTTSAGQKLSFDISVLTKK